METDREFSFVGLLSLAQLISWGALYYSFAIVSVPIERDLGWDKATVNGAWSIGLLFTGLAAFPVGIFLDRLGGRIIMTGGTLLGVACLLLFAAARMSAFGTKRTWPDVGPFVRFRATADRHARVASTASVVNDPKRT
jgi:MFS family permease